MTEHERGARGLLDERGVALPLALFGLVAVSLLVSSALLTSSTEVALSRAHQDGTRGLYAAETSLESFVAERAVAVPQQSRLLAGSTTGQFGGAGAFNFDVSLLAQTPVVSVGNQISRTETYSIVAAPAGRRGRSVGALLEVSREGTPFQITVDAGLTVGGDIQVTGNSTVSDGRNTDCHEPDRQAGNAIQVSAGSRITQQGSAVIEGKADTASYHKSQMVNLILAGMSLPQAAQELATVRFGPGEFNDRARSTRGGVVYPATDRYNWGCPNASTDSCNSVPGNQSNRDYFPIVAIDANGGRVIINGDHGQGILIVHNGSAEIRGNFVYNGIVLVERDLVIQGTGGTDGVKIEGAVVALGENSTIEDNLSGNAVVTFNRCVVNVAQASASERRIESAAQMFRSSTFAWFEVVR
jgi:hypothetical protein